MSTELNNIRSTPPCTPTQRGCQKGISILHSFGLKVFSANTPLSVTLFFIGPAVKPKMCNVSLCKKRWVIFLSYFAPGFSFLFSTLSGLSPAVWHLLPPTSHLAKLPHFPSSKNPAPILATHPAITRFAYCVWKHLCAIPVSFSSRLQQTAVDQRHLIQTWISKSRQCKHASSLQNHTSRADTWRRGSCFIYPCPLVTG